VFRKLKREIQENPEALRVTGISPVDFVLETAIRALKSQEEFQTTLRNIRSITAADRHPLDSEESAGGHPMFSSPQ